MKIYLKPLFPGATAFMRSKNETSRRDKGREGMAVIVVLTLIAIVTIYIAYNLRTMAVLNRDLRLVERQQLQRLARGTNASVANVQQQQPKESANKQPGL